MKLIYGMIAVAWYGMLRGAFVWWQLLPWTLGMTVGEAQKLCPTPLISLYEKLHEDRYYACDDGKHTTVLVFSGAALSAIMDIKYFAKWDK